MISHDTNPSFILSRPRHEREELLDLLVQPDSVQQLKAWFKQRGRELTDEQAEDLHPLAIALA